MNVVSQVDAGSARGWGRETGWGLVSIVALLFAACGAGAPVVPAGGPGTLDATSPGEQAWALQVLDLTNLARTGQGLAPLELDERASIAAYAHAWDMHLRGYFDHVNPEGEGVQERLLRHGVECQITGENLARGHPTPQDVVEAWLASPVHRQTLLHPTWTHVGIGVHSGAVEGPWWAQAFYR